MKQPKVILPPVSAAVPAANLQPRYRYFSRPPAVVSLRAGDLWELVPESGRAKGFTAERSIDLPATEVFQGPVPRISLDRLAEIAPECFRGNGFQTFIRLPAGKLALGYRLVEDRELMPEEPPLYAPAPAAAEETVSESPSALPSPGLSEGEPLGETEEIQEIPAEPEAAAEATSRETQRLTPLRVAEPASPQPQAPMPPPRPPAPIGEALFRSPAALPKAPAPIRPVSAPSDPPLASPAEPKRPFSVLPPFRRKTPEPQAGAEAQPPPRVVPRRRIDLPPPRVAMPPAEAAPAEQETQIVSEFEPVPSHELSAEAALEETAAPPPVEAAAPLPEIEEPAAETFPPEPPREESPWEEPAAEESPLPEPEPPPAPPLSAVVMEAEHLPKAAVSVAGQEELQALFLTEESLTVDRVVELCGLLPGINSCVLSHGAAVIASHNVPDNIDLISLSAHALEMLSAMRTSSAKMGVGAIPAVTLHSEKGPITFFHREDLCLLVLHKDRGFVPGVREKLQSVVDELARVRLPKPLPSVPRILPAE